MAGGAQAFEPGDGFNDLLHACLGDGVFILLAGSLEGVPGEGVDEAGIAVGALDEGVEGGLLEGVALRG